MSIMVLERRQLADLVLHAQEQGTSYREMEARARRAGFVISHSQLADYAKNTVQKPPLDDQLQAIAAALDLGFETVRAAMFEQFYGYVPRELTKAKGSRISAAVPPDLTPEEERELIRMIRAWAAASRDVTDE